MNARNLVSFFLIFILDELYHEVCLSHTGLLYDRSSYCLYIHGQARQGLISRESHQSELHNSSK